MWRVLRKVFAVISFAVSVWILAALVQLSVETVQTYRYVSSRPGTSGVDYLPFVLLPVFLGLGSLAGAVCSFISVKLFKNKPMVVISAVLCFLFVLAFVACLGLWIYH